MLLRMHETVRARAVVHTASTTSNPQIVPLSAFLFLLVADEIDTTTQTPRLQGTTCARAQGMDGGKCATHVFVTWSRSTRAGSEEAGSSNGNQSSHAKENRHCAHGKPIR